MGGGRRGAVCSTAPPRLTTRNAIGYPKLRMRTRVTPIIVLVVKYLCFKVPVVRTRVTLGIVLALCCLLSRNTLEKVPAKGLLVPPTKGGRIAWRRRQAAPFGAGQVTPALVYIDLTLLIGPLGRRAAPPHGKTTTATTRGTNLCRVFALCFCENRITVITH